MAILLLGGGSGSAVGGGGGGSDPNFSSVVLLMGFEGTNGATGSPGMNDESGAAHGTATRTNTGATISTAQFKFGASSLVVADSTSGIYFSDSNDWNLGAGSFTIEMFIRPTAVGGTQFLCGQWQSSLAWAIFLSGTSLTWINTTNGSTQNFDISSVGTVANNTWYHVCVDFDGSKYRMYLAGTLIGSFSTPRTLFNSTDALTIGNGSTGLAFSAFQGYMDEFRITKGTARYANDSGLTVPTAAFPRS